MRALESPYVGDMVLSRGKVEVWGNTNSGGLRHRLKAAQDVPPRTPITSNAVEDNSEE